MGRREDKRERRKQVIVSVLIIFLMVMSAFAVLLGSSTSTLKYGKFKFKQDATDSLYYTKIAGKEMYFYALPSAVDYINLSNSAITKLKSAEFIMTTFDPESKTSLGQIELARFDLSQNLDKPVVSGVLKNSTLYALPVITCDNKTENVVLVFNVTASEIPDFVEEGNCIYINARANNFLFMRDRLLYAYYGVIVPK